MEKTVDSAAHIGPLLCARNQANCFSRNLSYCPGNLERRRHGKVGSLVLPLLHRSRVVGGWKIHVVIKGSVISKDKAKR